MNYLCEVRTVFRHAMRLQPNRLSVAKYSKSAEPKDDEIYDEDKDGKLSVSEVFQDEVNLTEREEEIERMRNKSRLNKTHRNVIFNLPKPDDEYKWDKTLYFSRTQFGHFGSKTGIDPRLCFYTQEELADQKEYERVAYPYTIPEIVEANKKAKAEKLLEIRKREEKIAQNLTKLDKWMVELNQRVLKKEEDAIAAKNKREQLLEDIRQEFGFKIDQRDPRFQALMEKKELEAKKAKKSLKKAKQEELLREKLKQQAEKVLEEKEAAKKSEAAEQEGDEKEVAGKSEDSPKEKAKKGKANEKQENGKKEDSSSSSSSDSETDGENEKKNK